MDTEMFTNEAYGGDETYGGSFNPFRYGKVDVKTEQLDKHVQVAQVKVMHATKMFMRAVAVLAIVYLIVMLFCKWIPDSIQAWKGYTGVKSDFSQKENLQWLGASTDIVRGDYENNQDSLAERSMKTDARITDISQPMPPAGAKLTFMSRERYTSPEEELMKQHHQV